MVEPIKGAKSGNQWIRNNLVTLGSAAVFTVYSAGYFRTREAADRFAGESVQRRAAVSATSAAATGAAARSGVASSAVPSSGTAVSVTSPKPSTVKSAASNAPAVKSGADSSAAPPSITAQASAADPQPAPADAATPVVDSSATAPEKRDENQLKDGTFNGWGTSRHGDIQASVEIKNGKIVSAWISQCLTRYSCSWISMLPPEVVQRQSAEVDYVSGATQSSNAFYYAIVEALKQAK
jgi:uncharacterized protein with FMN-binding domain